MVQLNSSQIAELEKNFRVNLINSVGGYKSLNLLGTINEDKITNLSIISSAFHMGSNPPLFGLIIRPEREHNDTLKNIKSTGQYTLNNVLPEWYENAHQTSASYPSGFSEFAACGFNEWYADGFAAPFVAQSTVKMGLELREIVEMKINGTTLVIGEVTQLLANDTLIGDDGFVDHVKAATLAVAGLDSYYSTVHLGRLAYAKPGVATRKIE